LYFSKRKCENSETFTWGGNQDIDLNLAVGDDLSLLGAERLLADSQGDAHADVLAQGAADAVQLDGQVAGRRQDLAPQCSSACSSKKKRKATFCKFSKGCFWGGSFARKSSALHSKKKTKLRNSM
jgi:hypothetical protein